MKYSNVVKAMLFTSIHELAANPEHYVLHPGKDFSRNRKLGFQRLLLMLLTMEGDCIKEELYRYFGRSTDTPSKAAFYKQRKKVKEDAFRSLLVSFTQKYQKKLLKGKYSLVACDGSAADISGIPMIRIRSLNQTESPPEDLTKSISMLSFLFWTKNLRIS